MFPSVVIPWVVSTESTLSKYFTCRNQKCLQNSKNWTTDHFPLVFSVICLANDDLGPAELVMIVWCLCTDVDI